MSSAAPTKRDQAPNTLPAGKGILDWLQPLVGSTVGMKVIVALSGLGLVGFVIGHMVGHLKMFGGQFAYNGYAKFLKDLGPLLWIARAGILTLFVLHIVFTVKLKYRAMAARPVAYQYSQTVHASTASRSMMWLGSLILIFVLFHIAHFTLGYVVGADLTDPNTLKPLIDPVTREVVRANYLDLRDPLGHVDVYTAMISSFHNPLIAVPYLFAMFVLFLHLSHGIASLFQTLGLNTPRTQGFYKVAGQLLAAAISLGYSLVVIAVWSNWIKPAQTFLAIDD